MASSTGGNSQNSNIWHWIGIFIAFCISAPLGILLAIIKIVSMQNNKKRNDAREQWQKNGQQWQQGTQSRQNGGQAANPYQGSGYRDQTQANQYASNQPHDAQGQSRADSAWSQNAGKTVSGGNNRAQNQAFHNIYSTSTQNRWNPRLLSKLTNPRRGRAMALCGGCMIGIFSFCGIMTLLDEFWMFSYGMGTELLAELMALIFCAGVGAVMLSFGRKKSRQAKKYREYITIIGWQNAVSLRDLARITNTGYSKVCDDMSDLLSQGIFGNEAYLDLSAQYLILNRAGQDEVYRSAERAKQEAEEKKAQEKAAGDATPEDAILAEIRRVNDDIADERLSAQIDRIEEITRLILQYQKEHPEKKTQLHSFLSYYLPTTLKILNSYAEMENQSIQGRNITETRQQIEGIMDKVVTGFETQLDQLFAEDRMDITSEINVLENMMRQDGLTSDDEADPFGQFRGQTQNG